MERLLAVKLTNLVKKWADSRGLPIEGNLENKKRYGAGNADKVTHCKGEFLLPTKKFTLYFSTEQYECKDTFTVVGHFDDFEAINVSSFTVYLKDLDDTLDNIVKTLDEMAANIHEGLAGLELTGLPDLAHNPILATYLSDVPNANNNAWVGCRDKISKLLAIQGVDTSMHPNLDCYEGNPAGSKLYEILHSRMCGNSELGHTYYHSLMLYHQPLPCETGSGCLTYYQDDRKRRAGIRTPIKIRKYLDKFFRNAFAANKLCMDKDHIINEVTYVMTPTDDLDVRIYDDSDLDGWAEAYGSEKISSCMSTLSINYGVGEHETYRCYLTNHFTDGAFSSGLSLAVLYNAGEPVARSIVYEQDGQKYYVRNYSDDRLVKWLKLSGYEHRGSIPYGTKLWTCEHDDGAYICPYVDGDSLKGEADARFEHIDGHDLWIIDPDDGDHTLQVTEGYIRLDGENLCECCGRDRIANTDIPDYSGGTIDLCEDCHDHRVYYIDREWQYCRSIYSSDLVRDNDDDWYSPKYLSRTNQFVVNGQLCDYDDYFYCNCTDEWVHKSDGIDLCDAPDFITNSWSGYSDGGYVSKDVYYHYGFELDYYSDYLISDCYATSVSLDGTDIVLADDHFCLEDTTLSGATIVMPRYSLASYDKDLYDRLTVQADKAANNPNPAIIYD